VSARGPANKAAIRRDIRALLKNMSPARRTAASRMARERLEQETAWKDASTLFVYAPLPEELDIWSLVEDAVNAGKVVCLPRFDADSNGYVACQVRSISSDMVIGQFGVREPRAGCAEVSLNRLDLVLVPGVAFDLRGRRIGRGKGFYDRLLSATRGLKCGVAFDEQILTEIPIEPHDVPVDCILTPTRWIEPWRGGSE
jgi:5-formyltetrahydrofolate cyclo-ligase